MPPITVRPSFAADAMLGRLARWLRVLGFDTVYDPALNDRDIVEVAAKEDRILLTRDRHLVTYLRPRRAILLMSESPFAQLREVIGVCDIALPRDLFTRCLICNSELSVMTPVEVAALVPDRVRHLEGPFLRCPKCRRIYWPGSHVRRMRAALAKAFPEQYS